MKWHTTFGCLFFKKIYSISFFSSKLISIVCNPENHGTPALSPVKRLSGHQDKRLMRKMDGSGGDRSHSFSDCLSSHVRIPINRNNMAHTWGGWTYFYIAWRGRLHECRDSRVVALYFFMCTHKKITRSRYFLSVRRVVFLSVSYQDYKISIFS